MNQVEQTVAGSGSPAPSTVGPSASQHPQQSVVSTATTVRRVDACEPLIFDFSHVPSPSSLDIRAITAVLHESDSGLDPHASSAVRCEVFDMTYSDFDSDWSVAPDAPSPHDSPDVCAAPDAPSPHEMRMPQPLSLSGVPSAVVLRENFILDDAFSQASAVDPVSALVRAVRGSRPEVNMEVILDSGADLSCLPIALGSTGVRGPKAGRIAVRDAQGGRLPVSNTRDVEFALQAHDGREVIWRERCIVTSVTQPLLALGKLMRSGWIPAKDDFGMYLQHQESGVMVPIDFRGNSLMVHATLHRVDGEEAGSTVIEEIPEGNEDEEEASVRFTCAAPSNELVDAAYGWQTLESSGHFVWRGRTDRFVDPATLVPISWPNRTTLVWSDGGWNNFLSGA